ncbi:hypothetical protein IR083_19915 [Dysgonomonas sp. GY75]|uniref:hypothetical protein n=1 Tax=Dysgonomonas sp. GY75 TaxID=2780419 RepID=UPI001883C37C|nr:hypothetical protein [Dysgonomonas sp. GY75]MBF0651087.1 hypothetical protein [Dysgonomonas sp. GY75]
MVKKIIVQLSADIYERWGIPYSRIQNRRITKRPVSCSFGGKPLDCGFVIAVRNEIIGITGIEYMKTLTGELFTDKNLEYIELLAFSSEKGGRNA